MLLYHATNYASAQEIHRQQRFHCGPRKNRFAGSAVYFCKAKAETGKRYLGGKDGRTDVVIKCEVDLGTLIEAKKYKVQNQTSCRASGGDSVKVTGVDVFAVYDPDRIRIIGFEDCHTSCEWKPVACAPQVLSPSLHIAPPVSGFREHSTVVSPALRSPPQVLSPSLHTAPPVSSFRERPTVASQALRSPVVAAPWSIAAVSHPDVEELLWLEAPALVNMLDKIRQAPDREAQSCCCSM